MAGVEIVKNEDARAHADPRTAEIVRLMNGSEPLVDEPGASDAACSRSSR